MDHPKTILVAEDDPVTRLLYRDELQDDGYKVIMVENGYEVLFNLENEKVDLLITDTSMPLMDVYDMIGRARAQAPQLPIVVITGHLNEQDFKDKDCAIQGYFHKPVSMRAVKAMLRSLLEAGE